MSKKVSIIIPVFNVEQYLEDCLNSILNQTYQNYEIIAINDGSTDKSLDILLKYQPRLAKKLHIINQENQGQSAARNNGIIKSTGELIYFLDSDDFIAKNTLEKCVNIFKQHDVDTVFFNASIFADSIAESECAKFHYTRGIAEGRYKNTQLFSLFLNNKYIVSPCCFMVRKKSIADLLFPIGLLHEDNYYTTKILVLDNTHSYVISDALFQRRIRPNSIMTQKKTMQHAESYYSVAQLLFAEEGQLALVRLFCLRLLEVGITIEESLCGNIHPLRRIQLAFESLKYDTKCYRSLRILMPTLYKRLKNLLSR